ncbi:MAG TPA: alpha/beta hydrolase [Pseudonocardia sp.]|jgi:pimeloyl-ACP methyl ester carboxylesterase
MTYYLNPDGHRFHYQDRGDGPAVLLVHSWAMDSAIWEYLITDLVAAGYRCVAMDRRGHGRSDEPGAGYDLDTLADDLAALLEHLDLREVTAVGHSMGCGEIVRYLGRHGDGRIARAAFLGAIAPYLRGAVGEQFYRANLTELTTDRPAWFATRADGYFARPASGVSRALADEAMAVALRTPLAVLTDCVAAGAGTDLTDELPRVRVPVLVVHGDADQSAPLELTGRPTARLLPDARLLTYPGGAHGLYVTHRDRLTTDLLGFLELYRNRGSNMPANSPACGP